MSFSLDYKQTWQLRFSLPSQERQLTVELFAERYFALYLRPDLLPSNQVGEEGFVLYHSQAKARRNDIWTLPLHQGDGSGFQGR